jgi:hypothetical protein
LVRTVSAKKFCQRFFRPFYSPTESQNTTNFHDDTGSLKRLLSSGSYPLPHAVHRSNAWLHPFLLPGAEIRSAHLSTTTESSHAAAGSISSAYFHLPDSI